MMDQTIDELRAELASLRAEVDALRAATTVPPGRSTPPSPRTSRTSKSSRRTILTAAAAATGAVLAGGGRPVAATEVTDGEANGDALAIGRVNVCTDTTELKFPLHAPSAPYNHVFVAQDGAWSTPRSPPGGENTASVAAFSGNWVTHGMFGQTNAGNSGSSGGRFVGILGGSYGVWATGGRAAMRLSRLTIPGTQQLPPTDRFDEHRYGEFLVDDNDDVWVCVEDGNPGTWRKIAGRSTAGSFHPIVPTRVVDSRSGDPLTPGTGRAVSVAGPGGDAEVVPRGATAITFNLTATATTGPNFLSVVPGDATSYTASTINFPGGVDVANGTVVRLDSERRVRVFCGDQAGSAHFIIDVTGYYL